MVLAQKSRPQNDRREIAGWLMYDWANSAFQTTVITVLAGPYLTALAQHDVGRNGIVATLGPFGSITALSLFPYCISASAFLQVLFLPVLGTMADYSSAKKRLMAGFCYGGVAATCLLFFITAHRYLVGGVLVIVANFAFGVTIVLYNSFLNDITTEDQRDKVSSQGYALGYLGGGLLLAANLGLVSASDRLGISTELAVRISLLSAGVWWGGFALITFARLQTRAATRARPSNPSSLAVAFAGLRGLWTDLTRLPHTRRYLIAYMAFNDAIQTIISIASVFLAQELFVSRGLPTNEAFLMGLVLMVQFVAFGGALLFERIAVLLNTKNAIVLSLVIWTGIVVYAYGLLQTVAQAWMMGAVLAMVLGGSQALSRSLFSQMIPAGHEAGFFGVYEITERGSSWIGPFLFGLVASVTGSYRQAILSLVVLFLAGMFVLLFTDAEQAVRDASRSDAVARRTSSLPDSRQP
ncbi:MAG: MFS transporter [Acidobacteriia bacterium]|nr:MFS transporter [Terriglobia bacterium]